MSYFFWFSGTDCSYGKLLWFIFELDICGCFSAFGINNLRLSDKTLNPDCCLVIPPPDVSAPAVAIFRPQSADRSAANPASKNPSRLHYWSVVLWGERQMYAARSTPSPSHCYITQQITHSVFIWNHRADLYDNTSGLLKKVTRAQEVSGVYRISLIRFDVKERRWLLHEPR